ncbi:MAG TPA: tRNA-guanine transglycosylase [Methanoregulaceae archaeon]|nr:tRNA-guanine transglycosylase [Methanoregulaceae archaeon]
MARIHSLITAHGDFETPLFFPVNDFGDHGHGSGPKYITEIPDLRSMLVNVHLLRQSGMVDQLSLRGLHDFFGVNGVFMVDSGGFQAHTDLPRLKHNEILHFQEAIGADIAIPLDTPVFPVDSIAGQQHMVSMQVTIRNALWALENREREEMLVYAPLHGNSSQVMVNMLDYLQRKGDFDGFAIGGLVPKRSDLFAMVDLIVAVRRRLKEKPLHVLGIGGPALIPLLVYLGVDTFDSSSYIRAGANRVYFLPDHGSVSLLDLDLADRLPCVCPVCSVYAAETIRAERRLIGLHNLWMIAYELRKLKLHIRQHDLETYLDHRFARNPVMQDVFRYAKSKMRGLV